jgi:hypothetical protein
MNLPQRFCLALTILVLFSMLLYLMPEEAGQVRIGAWAILLQIGTFGLILSRRSKE